jgi:hypothetical protein
MASLSRRILQTARNLPLIPVILGVTVTLAGAAYVVHRARSGGAQPDDALRAREAVLLRQRQGLEALIARAERGPLVPLSGDQAVVVIDQKFVESLLAALVPSERVIAERYRVRVERASVSFEDGFALVKLDGRASLAGADDDVYADLSAYGDLDVLRTQPNPEVLQARIHIVAVEARPMELPIGQDQAKDLVEELSKAKLEEFASLASSLQFPVRQQHAFEIPAAGPAGPVRIEAATIPFHLSVLDVTAFHGKLWISMAAGIEPRLPNVSSPVQAMASPAPTPGSSPAARMDALQRQHQVRHEYLEELLSRDPFLDEAARTPGDMVLAMRAGFVRQVIEEIAGRYFDRVAIELEGLDVREGGSVHKDTPLGHRRVGDWTVAMRIHRVGGFLRAGRPRLRFDGDNRVALTFPAHLESGTGSASLDFKWDSRGLANLVCRDFRVEQQLDGTVVPEEYPVSGTFVLKAVGQSLTAQPRFTDKFRVKLDLSPESWAAVRAQLEAQDKLMRCGVGLDPDKVLAELRELATGKGFDVKIPRRLFRTITLPAPVAQSVSVDEQQVRLALEGSALRVTSQALWYRASVGVQPEAHAARRPAAEPASFALLHAPVPGAP